MRTGITDKVRNLRLFGKSIDEICEIVNYSRKEVTRICRKSGMGITDEEKQIARDRVNKGFTHTEEWAKQYIFEKSCGVFEYVSGYANMDSHCIVRCTRCGNVEERSMVSFRHESKSTCVPCKSERQ